MAELFRRGETLLPCRDFFAKHMIRTEEREGQGLIHELIKNKQERNTENDY